jgi:uncharacterized membrane protein
MSYTLTAADRARGWERARSAESRARRRAAYRAEEKEAVRFLHAVQGLVPLAIGPTLGLPDSTVARYLRELEREGSVRVPAYLSLRTPGEP